MTSIALPVVTDDHRGGAGSHRTATGLVRGSMEAVVLVMVCLSPWAFGAVEPEHEFLLDVGIAVLMILWGARMLLDGQLSWRKCPVAVCLAAWIFLGVWQLTPLPRGLLSRISPVTTRMYDRLLPAQPEVLPFGEPRGVSIPPAGSTLSFYPGATRRELGRYLAILLLFAVVRNNIASSASLRRLGIAALVNGSLLALFGLVQAFSADPQTIYWSYPAPGGRCLRPLHQPESLRVSDERLRGPRRGAAPEPVRRSWSDARGGRPESRRRPRRPCTHERPGRYSSVGSIRWPWG